MKTILFILFLAAETFAATNYIDRFDDFVKMYPAPNLDARTTNVFFGAEILGGSRKVVVDYDENDPYTIWKRRGRPLWPYFSLFIGNYEIKGDWEVRTGFPGYPPYSDGYGISLSTGPSYGTPLTFQVTYNNNGGGLFYSPVADGHQNLHFRMSTDHLTNFWVYLQDVYGTRTTVNYNFNGQLYVKLEDNIPLHSFFPVDLEMIDEIGIGMDDKVSMDGGFGDLYFWGPELPYGDCEGKVAFLKMIWMGGDSHIILAAKSSGGRGGSIEILYSGTVTNRQEVQIVGSDHRRFRGTLGVEVTLVQGGILKDTIHTSCSQPIGYGSRLGDFFITEARDSVGHYLILP